MQSIAYMQAPKKKVCNPLHTFYICDVKKLSMNEAWADFWAHVKGSPQWDDIPRREKQYIYKAKKAAAAGKLGMRRFETLTDKYAPGRYRFQVEESVYLND